MEYQRLKIVISRGPCANGCIGHVDRELLADYEIVDEIAASERKGLVSEQPRPSAHDGII